MGKSGSRSRSRSPHARKDRSTRNRFRSRSKDRDRDKDRDRERDRDRDRDRERDRKERRRSASPRSRRRSRSRSPHRRRPQRKRSDSKDGAKGGAVPKYLLDRPQITEKDLEGKSEEEQQMMKMMGFGTFDTTKGRHVPGNDVYAVHVVQKRKYRQYMNRKGGFNRPLDFVA